MRSTYPRSVIALITALFLLLPGGIGPQENPADASEDAVAARSRANAAKHDDKKEFKRPETPFARAEVFFEFNTTHNDLGLQLLLDAEGWETVGVSDPDKDTIIDFKVGGGLKELGLTELRFESAEPSPPEVLALFPPGEYTFSGQTVEGNELVGTSTLSHDFLPEPTFSPSDGQLVDPKNAVVTWNAPDAELVEVILESEEHDGVFDVIVPGSTTRLDVPPQFLQPDAEYRIEILALAENGNRTIVESTFVTKP